MSADEELEALRQRRLRELQNQIQLQAQQQAQRVLQEQQISAQIRYIMNQILEPEARQRLANIRYANPEYARQIEILLIQLYQAGQLPRKVSDEQLKKILEKIHEKKKETKISWV